MGNPIMLDINLFFEIYSKTITYSEKIFVKTYIQKGYEVFGLKNCKSDFVIRKDGIFTLVEVKTTSSPASIDIGILQLLYGKDIVENTFKIGIKEMLLWCMFEKENLNDLKKIQTKDGYLEFFKIKKEILYKDNSFFIIYDKNDCNEINMS